MGTKVVKSFADLNVGDVSPLTVEGAVGGVLTAKDMAEARRLAKRAANRSTFRPAGIYKGTELVALVTADSIGKPRRNKR